MKVKSFFAGSVEEALGEARREFGPEAVLVQSRRSPADARHLGEYEVVCALLPEDARPSESVSKRERSSADQPAANAEIRRLTGEMTELKRCLERLQTSVALAGATANAPGTPPEVREAMCMLLAAELDPELAQRIVGEACSSATTESRQGDFIAGTGANLGALIHRCVVRLACAGRTPDEDGPSTTKAVALAGPPGAGKTTCIAKLAARYAISMPRDTHVVALDEYRVGGSEQLRAFADILGVSFEALANDTALSHVLEAHRNALVLVDVPGFNGLEMDLAAQLARRLRALNVEVHLVLPASMRAADLRRISKSYAVFEPMALAFTRLDETETYGPLLNEIVRTGKPASFLSTGPRVPEDIEPATRVRIADLVLSRFSRNARKSWAAA